MKNKTLIRGMIMGLESFGAKFIKMEDDKVFIQKNIDTQLTGNMIQLASIAFLNQNLKLIIT